MSVRETLSLREIGAVMCAVASENTWKRGRRNFMVTSKDIFGIKLMVRWKSITSKDRKVDEIVALNSDNWRIAFEGFVFILGLPHVEGKERINVPKMVVTTSYNGREKIKGQPITQIGERIPRTIVFDIQDEADFERDWTLLRLFSSEWDAFK